MWSLFALDLHVLGYAFDIQQPQIVDLILQFIKRVYEIAFDDAVPSALPGHDEAQIIVLVLEFRIRERLNCFRVRRQR